MYFGILRCLWSDYKNFNFPGVPKKQLMLMLKTLLTKIPTDTSCHIEKQTN